MKLHYFAANLSVVILKGNVNTLFKSYILVVCMPSIFLLKIWFWFIWITSTRFPGLQSCLQIVLIGI